MINRSITKRNSKALVYTIVRGFSRNSRAQTVGTEVKQQTSLFTLISSRRHAVNDQPFIWNREWPASWRAAHSSSRQLSSSIWIRFKLLSLSSVYLEVFQFNRDDSCMNQILSKVRVALEQTLWVKFVYFPFKKVSISRQLLFLGHFKLSCKALAWNYSFSYLPVLLSQPFHKSCSQNINLKSIHSPLQSGKLRGSSWKLNSATLHNVAS